MTGRGRNWRETKMNSLTSELDFKKGRERGKEFSQKNGKNKWNRKTKWCPFPSFLTFLIYLYIYFRILCMCYLYFLTYFPLYFTVFFLPFPSFISQRTEMCLDPVFWSLPRSFELQFCKYKRTEMTLSPSPCLVPGMENVRSQSKESPLGEGRWIET